jgi:hypothetical protein
MSGQPPPTFSPKESVLSSRSNHALVFDSSGDRRLADDLERELTADLENHISFCEEVDALMVGLGLRTLPPVPANVPADLPSGTQPQAIEHLRTYISQCGGDAGNHGFDAICFSGPNSSLKGRYADRWAVQEKPDGAIYKKQSGCDAEKKTVEAATAEGGGKQKTAQTHCWEEIEIPVEVTKSAHLSKFKQAVRYLWEVLYHQWGRHIAWCLLFFTTDPPSAWLLACNHGQLLTCRLTPVSLARFLNWYIDASPADRGHDIRYTHIDGRIKLKLSNGSEIALHTILMRDCRLLGRNTHVAVFHDKEGKTYVVKDAWPQDHREEERLTELKILGINGMPKLSDNQPIKDSFQVLITKTGFTWAQLPLDSKKSTRSKRVSELTFQSSGNLIGPSDQRALKRMKLDESQGNFLRCHASLVLETYGETLYSRLPLLTPDLLVHVLGDCIDTHWESFDKAFILHGDITLHNILVLPEGSALTGSSTSTIVGCPIDLDYSYKLDENHQVLPSQRYARSGAPAFICPWLLAKDRRPRRSYRTDLDSFFWCILYCATFAGNRDKTARMLDFLNEHRDYRDVVAMKGNVLSPARFEEIPGELQPGFQTPRFQTLIRGFAKEVSLPLFRWHFGWVDEDEPEPAVDYKTMCDLHQKIAALIKSYWSTEEGD